MKIVGIVINSQLNNNSVAVLEQIKYQLAPEYYWYENNKGNTNGIGEIEPLSHEKQYLEEWSTFKNFILLLKYSKLCIF